MADITGGDTHPNDDLLLALHDGVLFPGDRPKVEAHLKGCARCRARLTALTEDISIPATVATSPPSRPASTTRPGHILSRLAVALVLLVIVAAAGIVGMRELSRRSSEPVALATTPTVPEPAPPRPLVEAAPLPAAEASTAPPIETTVTPPDAAATAPTAAPVVADAMVITSPNRNFRWRVVGLDVERTTDNGTQWRKQAVELKGPVAAGTAPSAAVCWLVGRGGTVFVATGSQWKNVSLTEMPDLVSVAAIDSMNATVTAMDGRQFSTSDAGVTWSLLSPQ